MRIRSRIKIIIAILVTFVGLLFLVDFTNEKSLDEAMDKIETVSKINRKIFEVSVLTNDYVIYHTDRARQQWWQVYEHLGGLIKGFPLHSEEEKKLATNYLSRYEDIGNMFSTITASYEKSLNNVSTDESLQVKLRDRMSTRLLLNTQVMRDDLIKLRSLSMARLKEIRGWARTVTFILQFLLLMVVVVNAVIIYNSLIEPLEKLHRAIFRISKGRFNHKIGLNSRDEIGRLGRAFDRMTDNLKTVTASRDELDEAQRKLAAQTQQLQTSNKALEQFAHVVSHDLQEPLFLINSTVDVLIKRLGSKLSADELKYLNFIKKGAMHSTALIKEVLQVSKVTYQVALVEVDLQQVMEEVTINLKKMIEESNAKIEWSDLPTVHATQISMVQIFQNIISNAIKYCEVEPRIMIKHTLNKNNHWEFTFQDNGIGIRSEDQGRIFEMFERIDHEKKYDGSGIGLNICKKIVNSLGGEIWVTSKPGQGCTFYFTLPR